LAETNSHLVVRGRIAKSLTASQVKTAQHFYTDHQAMTQALACDALTPVHLHHDADDNNHKQSLRLQSSKKSVMIH